MDIIERAVADTKAGDLDAFTKVVEITAPAASISKVR